MRLGWVEILVALGVWCMVSCGGAGPTPIRGDMGAGDEPLEGGIAEVPNPSIDMAKKSGKSLGQIQRGHEVYMLKCGECHQYQLPKNLDTDEWEEAIPKMIRHAGLEAADEKAVLDYVIAVKKEAGQ